MITDKIVNLIQKAKISLLPSSYYYQKSEVIIPINKEQIKELESALQVIERYKQTAIEKFKKEYKYHPQNCGNNCVTYDYSINKNNVKIIIVNN